MPNNAPHNALRHYVSGAIDRGEAEPITAIDPSDELIAQGIYAAGDSGDPNDHPPTFEEDPSFYDCGVR